MARDLVACHCCGLVQSAPAAPPAETAGKLVCARCGTGLRRARAEGARNRLTCAAALAALLLFPVAVGLPIMRLERFGHARDASIWEGSVGLLGQGDWLVGGLVFACSVVIPLGKLAGLLLLARAHRLLALRQRAWTYRWIEWTGRYGMLDVLLIAVLVAWLKLGDLVEVRAGPAALAFTACVVLSLVATAAFDPHALWEER